MPRSTTVFSLIAALLATAAAAGAQTYSGQDSGTRVLLYPGGQYGRVVAPLREPGEYTGAIKLRKPGKKASLPVDEVPERPKHLTATLSPPTKREEKTRLPAKQTAERKTAAAPPPTIRDMPQVPAASEFDNLMVAKPQKNTNSKQAAKQPPAVKPVAIKPPESKPVRTAIAETAPRRSQVAGAGSRRGTIPFDANASDPSGTALQTIGKLADDLNGSMMPSSSRIQLLAYAGPKGEKNSDSRRLSLKRALIVRQLLIDAGVPADRIDVRAMGGADDAGAADRVDIFVKG
jgi:outer membrane protein OmpA-like peptidoglycan-associated protein